MSEVRIGVIGGSGLYHMEGLDIHEDRQVSTPFGDPSDSLVIGEIDGSGVAFLARHGRGHRILPSELNFRANIHAFKQLGVEWIVSVSAVGSMKEEYRPTDILVPDQFFDRDSAPSGYLLWRWLGSPRILCQSHLFFPQTDLRRCCQESRCACPRWRNLYLHRGAAVFDPG